MTHMMIGGGEAEIDINATHSRNGIEQYTLTASWMPCTAAGDCTARSGS